MKKISIFSALVFAFVMVVPSLSASAIENQPRVVLDRATDVRPVDILPIDRCTVVQKRVKNAIKNIQDRANKKKQKYEEIQRKLKRIINLAEEHGVDPSVLVKDLAVLEEKVENFSAEGRELIGILEKAYELACSDDQQSFQDALKKARIQLKVVRDQAKDIKDFIQNTLVPDARKILKEILTQYE